ncbi:MAG: heme A synthase [Bacteroidetes bacterium]|nr:MAG: heme A synthase [Bacteroidota bacterium]TAG89497.1 MAG: heme A synthase [Bacteroidota bacterium]
MSSFQKIGIVTIIAVYLLIWVGGLVRSTGSGMGCPDWPKCFGQWIPPTDEKELPKNYKDVYAQKRKDKNEKLAKYLDFLGWIELSNAIKGDKNTYFEADFNATKTWIEYINRLIGVLIGFLIILTFIFSLKYWKENKLVVYLSALSIVLVLFQGWIGSIVVSTNLLPGLISFHMSLAILQVFILMWAVGRSFKNDNTNTTKVSNTLNIVLIVSIILVFIQIILGTQVRQAVDIVAKKLGEGTRGTWVENLGIEFYIHRSFSWLILFFHIWLVFQMKKLASVHKKWFNLSKILVGIVIVEFLSGVGLAYLGMPAVLQPLHLLLAVLIIGFLFMLLILVNPRWFMKSNNKQEKKYQLV